MQNVKVASPASGADCGAKGGAGQKKSLAEEQHLASARHKAKRPRRLLIVDDSKMNLMVLKALLKHLGDFDVVTAGDGQEALDALVAPDAGRFDIVLTDIWMPRMDGGELVRAIRDNPSLSPIWVVAVTADVEFRDKIAEMGFDGMLLKPVTTNNLAKMLDEVAR
jgi:CheY-like chemotaxis protein